MFYLTTHSAHFYLLLYGVRYMVNNQPDSDRGIIVNLLLFLFLSIVIIIINTFKKKNLISAVKILQ